MRRRITTALLVAVLLLSAGYAWQNRYFLRFVPLPVSLVEWVAGTSAWLPASQPYQPLGAPFFSVDSLTTAEGLRKTLDEIQATSPAVALPGSPSQPPADFAGWVRWVRNNPFYCTDATQMFLLAANQQGLAAREWQLLLPGWVPGQGHSVAEFYNPDKQRWETVDPQHAAVLRDAAGNPASMAYILQRYQEGRSSDIVVDYGRFRQAMHDGRRGATVERYFFDMGLLATPVLQLRQPTWFAEVRGVGHPVIGYPIIVAGWTHDHRVLTAKLAALAAAAAGFALATIGARRLYRRIAGA